MAYATAEDVQRRMVKPLSDVQTNVCIELLEDASVLIDAVAPTASEEAKKAVSCSMVIRALGSQGEVGVPVKFVGVGEKIDDMQPFDAEEFVEALFEQ